MGGTVRSDQGLLCIGCNKNQGWRQRPLA